MSAPRKNVFLVAVAVVVGLPLAINQWSAVAGRWGRGGASAHLARGERALAAGHSLEAVSAFTHARELAPTDGEVQAALMRARAALVAEQPMRITADNTEDLRYEAGFLLERDRAHAAVYLTVLGNIAARTGNPDEAAAKFRAALEADPGSVPAHAAYGLFLLNQKGGAEQARADFEAVLKARPDHVVALVGLAQIELADGKPEPAAERLEAALKQGDDFSARMLLGGAKQRLGKNEEAAAQFQRATQLDPKSAEALRSLGQALLSLGKAGEAEKALRAASALQQDPQTVLALGFALARQKKNEQALSMFDAVLAQNASDAPALFGAASSLDELGRKEEAVARYKRLLSLPPQPGGQLIAQLQRQAQQRVAVLEGKTPEPSPMPPPPPSPGLPPGAR